jgi:uncharacterized SAM-binding protein YcdF (DUF218 family)
MFFTLSKLVLPVVVPSNLIAVIIGLGVLATATQFRRFGLVLSILGAILLFAFGLGPIGVWSVGLLENRFERPGADLAAPDGIIVLGGAISPEMLQYRAVLMPQGARMTEAVMLARRFPEVRVIFTGGSADSSISEAEAAKQFFTAIGLSPERTIYETRSRNTSENAAFTAKLIALQPGTRWLLVTSAFHMPRAIGAFRHVGFNVIPWPADYLSLGGLRELAAPTESVSEGLRLFDVGAKEWMGLLAYRVTGRIDDLFPGPI